MPSFSELLDFWYSEPMNQHWFRSTPEVDQLITEQFQGLWEQGAAGQLDDWKQTAESCLALIILLDQLPLNMFRGQAKSFSTEAQAIDVTLHGISQGYDKSLDTPRLSFFYMPLMHSESIEHQNLSIECFAAAELESNLRFSKHHKSIIERFGRFPHRNDILGRQSTQAEIDYLSSDEAFKG